MQIRKNRSKLLFFIKQVLQAFAFLLLIVLGAKVDINLGGEVSFTFQTLFLGLTYYSLPRKWSAIVVSTYILAGIYGLPVFNGGSGWKYVISWPLGFFVGFLTVVCIPKPTNLQFYFLLRYFIYLHLVILILGVTGIGVYKGSIDDSIDTMLRLIPGMIIKSTIGASILWIWHRMDSSLSQ